MGPSRSASPLNRCVKTSVSFFRVSKAALWLISREILGQKRKYEGVSWLQCAIVSAEGSA